MFHLQHIIDLIVLCIVIICGEVLNSRCAHSQNGWFTKPFLAHEMIVSVWKNANFESCTVVMIQQSVQ